MSHKATNWAIGVRGLKPATKIVLWHLADCHNAQTGVCNPIQATLASLCEMSRSTLNLHLLALEERGLIGRIQRVDPRTGRQLSTCYRLAVDADVRSDSSAGGTQDVVVPVSEIRTPAVSENRTPPVSEKPASPCPKNRDSRVRNPDSLNPGKEPGREPGILQRIVDNRASEVLPVPVGGTRSCGGASDALTFRERILEACGADPVSGLTGPSGQMLGTPEQMLHVRRWCDELGLSEDEILAVIQSRVAAMRHKTGRRAPVEHLRYFDGAMVSFATSLSLALPSLPLEAPLGPVGYPGGDAPGVALPLGNGRNPSLASVAAWRRLSGKV